MKKRISLLLILALLVSLCGCTVQPIQPISKPDAIQAPDITEATVPVEKITVPDLAGQQYHKLPQSDDYVLAISQTVNDTSRAEGTILGQAPSGGTEADRGVTVYLIVTTGGPEDPLPTEPLKTEPVESRPVYTEPDLPEQTDPPDMFHPSVDSPTEPSVTEPDPTEPPQYSLDPNGSYTSKEDVALYLYLYGRLPGNFVTKSQAKELYNWKSGSLSKYGKCIGGDRFYNNEGLLPAGYTYYECDIDTLYSNSRGSKRLVFTYSGIIYYTSDHYESFVRLY